MTILRGLRVLEIGEMVAAPYAAKLLADLGAEVIKIEPTTGDRARLHGPFPPHAPDDPEQSGLFLGLNTNKQSVALDLATPAGRARTHELVASCDILIHDVGPQQAEALGLDADTLLAKHPALVSCAITTFGHEGPHRDWVGEEITAVHGGGWGYMIPGDSPDPDAPPLTVFGHPATCQAAMAAAFAALGAHLKARQTGVGDFIDMSTMAHVASMLEASFVAWSYCGKIASRSEGRILNPWGIFPCQDGQIFLVTVEQDQWERLVVMMGNPEWALLDIFATNEGRAQNRDLLTVYLEQWTAEHTVDELFHEGQRQRICFAPVFNMADLAHQEHLQARGFFPSTSHHAAGDLTYLGAPFQMTPNPWQLRTGAPALNAHPDAAFKPRTFDPPTADPTKKHQRPLEGVRIIDFSWVWAGPFATMHLAYLGAEVIKIESTTRPGLGRRLPLHPPELEPTLNTSGYFNQWDQGKKSVELDLSRPESLATVLDLIKDADAVVDNYATGVMDRLGLSDEVLRQANPDLIIASITGFGHSGPLANYMGYGPTTAPLSGLTSMTGHLGGRPEEAGISIGDPAAGLTTAFAIMAALHARSQGDEPARIDVSLWEATAANAVELWMGHVLGSPAPERMGNRSPVVAPHGIFPCAGADEWISIACPDDQRWDALADLIGSDAKLDAFATVADRKTNEDRLDALIRAFTESRGSWELTQALQAVGVPAYPSVSCAELATNEHLEARGFWARFDHPEVGVRTHTGVPWRSHNAPHSVTGRAPLLGEHTNDILGI